MLDFTTAAAAVVVILNIPGGMCLHISLMLLGLLLKKRFPSLAWPWAEAAPATTSNCTAAVKGEKRLI